MRKGKILATSSSGSLSRFTLVELLVVIAILGILMSLSFPALSRMKKSGKRIGCISNLKQLGLAIQAYEQGNGGYYPYNCTSQRNANPDRIHLSAMLNIQEGSKVFQCPDEHEGLYGSEGSSYIWNWMQIELPGNEKVGAARYDTAPYGGLVSPDRFAIMIDAGAYHGKPGIQSSLNALYADGSADDASRINF